MPDALSSSSWFPPHKQGVKVKNRFLHCTMKKDTFLMAFFSPEFVFRLFPFPASVRASLWSKEPPSSSSRAATHKDQRPRPTTNMQVGANTQTHRRSFVLWSFCPYSLHKRAPGKQKNYICRGGFSHTGIVCVYSKLC